MTPLCAVVVALVVLAAVAVLAARSVGDGTTHQYQARRRQLLERERRRARHTTEADYNQKGESL